jgi:hypothetical protein
VRVCIKLLTTLRAVADSAVRPPPADEVSGIEQIPSQLRRNMSGERAYRWVSTWECCLHCLAVIGAGRNARTSIVFGMHAKTQSTGNWNRAVRTLAIPGALFTTATTTGLSCTLLESIDGM